MVRSPGRLPCMLAAVLLACGGGAPVPADAGSDAADAFSADRAWAELEMLVALGARPLGSAGTEAARSRIRENLEKARLRVETLETSAEQEGVGPITFRHLVATLPGASPDRFVLVAPYDSGVYDESEFVGANDGASGAVVLLEIARVLAGRDFPYTVQFVWLEGEGRLGRGEGAQRELRWLGSESLAAHWAESGELDGIRLLVVINRVCDADLQIARDLNSHRTHREEFWKAARRLGQSANFAPGRVYESVVSSHLAFQRHGVRPVVAIEDTAFGGDEAPGLYAGNAGDVPERCAPESLETVGTVVLEGLETIAARLAKIDRFSHTPSAPAGARQPPDAAPPVEPPPSAEQPTP